MYVYMFKTRWGPLVCKLGPTSRYSQPTKIILPLAARGVVSGLAMGLLGSATGITGNTSWTWQAKPLILHIAESRP